MVPVSSNQPEAITLTAGDIVTSNWKLLCSRTEKRDKTNTQIIMYLFTFTHTFTLAHSHTEHYFFNKCHTCKLPELNLLHYFRQVELTDPFCLFSLLSRQPKKPPSPTHQIDLCIWEKRTISSIQTSLSIVFSSSREEKIMEKENRDPTMEQATVEPSKEWSLKVG